MMKKVILFGREEIVVKYELKQDVLKNHFVNSLKGVNLLSDIVVNCLAFDEGSFYTSLVSGLKEELIYQFKCGDIAKGSLDIVVRETNEYLSRHTNSSCLFDDFDEEYKEGENWELYNQVGVHNEKAMYYLIENKDASYELIEKCFRTSNVAWHSLVILSDVSYSRKKDRVLSKQDMVYLVQNAKKVFLLAYEADGYLIWERDDVKRIFFRK